MKPNQARRVEANLVVQQEVFERAYETLLNGLKTVDKKSLESLKSSQAEADAQRAVEAQNLKKSLLAIAMVIKKLKRDIKDKCFMEEHGTGYFANHLTSIEENISSFKKLLKEQLDTLQQEENSLQESIVSLNRRLNETSNTPAAQHENSTLSGIIRLGVKSHTSSCSQEKIHPDVQEFQLFLTRHGGHTGGWDTNDHLMFTRFLQKYRGLNQMTTALLDFMPDKTPEEIAKHESWYHEYLTFKEAHRKALKEWREEQGIHKQKGEVKENENEFGFDNSKISHQRDPLEKEKIKQWKEKQEKVRQEQLQELQRKKMQEEESWKKKVAYFEQQRQLIAETRRVEQNHVKGNDPSTVKCEMNQQRKHIPLKEFWEQDKHYLQRRQFRLQNISTSPSHSRRTRSTSHSTVHVERDPARLLRPTAVWRARMKRSLSEDGSKQSQRKFGSLFIADVPHLAIPKWRVGLI